MHWKVGGQYSTLKFKKSGGAWPPSFQVQINNYLSLGESLLTVSVQEKLQICLTIVSKIFYF